MGHDQPQSSLRPGQILAGKYEILGEVGRGAMGVVYQASHVALGRRVAIKTLHAETSLEPERAARFEREARAASAIGHPNIVDVFDLGRTPDGLLFMAMELLRGQPLSRLLEQVPCLPVELAVDIVGQVLAGLTATHRNNVVHRDLKPDNIFIVDAEDRPNSVKLLDFGIAKVIAHPGRGLPQSGRGGTAVGTVLGTPLYMSPEQILGLVARTDHRTDIYSAGVVLYEMLCGRPPYQGESPPQLFGAILDGRYPPPHDLRPEIPTHIEAAIVRALSRDMNHRFADAAAMREAINGTGAQPLPSSELVLASPSLRAPARASPADQAFPPLLPVADQDLLPPPGKASDLILDRPSRPGSPVGLDRPPRIESAATASQPVASRARALPSWSRLALALALPALLLAARGIYPHLKPAAGQSPAAGPHRSCKVVLAVDPPDAVVHVDHRPAAREELVFEFGTSHVLEVSAPGRIARRVLLDTKTDLELTVLLGRTLPLPLLADPQALPIESTLAYPVSAASRDQIQHAFSKLDRYGSCLALLGFADGEWRKARIAALASNSAVSGCVQLLDEAASLSPPALALEAAAASYLRAVFDGQSGASLSKLLTTFRSHYLAARASWQMQELARQEADEGSKAAWHMRRVALATQAWWRSSRMASPGTPGTKDSLARLLEYQRALLDFARRSPHEMEGILGATGFMKSLQDMADQARGGFGQRLPAVKAIAACRQLLMAFNNLVL